MWRTSEAARLPASYAGACFAVYALNADGSVGEATQVTPTPPHAHCIVTDAGNRHLYVTSLGGDAILAYGFDPSAGRATPLTAGGSTNGSASA